MCGENCQIINKRIPHIGSPPRVRGKLKRDFVQLCPKRITPACAGKTGNIFGLKELNEDHPRVCGENRNALQCKRYMLGSPPRVRGKRCKDTYIGL